MYVLNLKRFRMLLDEDVAIWNRMSIGPCYNLLQLDHSVISMFPVTLGSSTSKEKHSLTRKLVGYRNWRQRWCKKEGNKVLGKILYFARVNVTEPKKY